MRPFFAGLAVFLLQTLALITFAVSVSFADSVRGKELYESRCMACHSVDQNRVGPAHQGVFGRKTGLAPSYDYSPALRKSKVIWSEKTLDAWLSGPEKLIPGQKMGYSVADAQDRADLIAYLKMLPKP